MTQIAAVHGAPAPSPAPKLEMEATARQFEAVFAGEMAKLMLESVAVSEDFGGGHAESMFRGMLAEELGRDMAARGGLNIAPVVLQQMIRMQEVGR